MPRNELIVLLLSSAALAACSQRSTVSTPPFVEVSSEREELAERDLGEEWETVLAEREVGASEQDAGEALPYEAVDVRSAISSDGGFVVKWRPTAGVVPNNESFELDLWLFRRTSEGLEPLPNTRLAVSAWMPDHGHGMLRRPVALDLGDGSYRVEGMLLHMGGLWQLFVDVLDADGTERAEFAFEL